MKLITSSKNPKLNPKLESEHLPSVAGVGVDSQSIIQLEEKKLGLRQSESHYETMRRDCQIDP